MEYPTVTRALSAVEEEDLRDMEALLSEQEIPRVEAKLVEEAVAKQDFLGRGTFGACFKLYGEDGLPLCVKVLHAHQKKLLPLWRSLIAEASQMLRVKDLPGIIRLVGVSLWPTPAIVTEYAGKALLDVLQTCYVSTVEAVSIMRQFACIVSEMNEANLCHADLKANNVVVRKVDGKGLQVTIIDLGMMQEFGFTPNWKDKVPKKIYAPELYKKGSLSVATQMYQVGRVFQTILREADVADEALRELTKRAIRKTASLRPTIEQMIDCLEDILTRSLQDRPERNKVLFLLSNLAVAIILFVIIFIVCSFQEI